MRPEDYCEERYKGSLKTDEQVEKEAAQYAMRVDKEMRHTWDISSLNKGFIAGHASGKIAGRQEAIDEMVGKSGEGLDEYLKEKEWKLINGSAIAEMVIGCWCNGRTPLLARINQLETRIKKLRTALWGAGYKSNGELVFHDVLTNDDLAGGGR